MVRWPHEWELAPERPLRSTGRRILLAVVSLILLVDLVILVAEPGPPEHLERYLFESLVVVVVALFAWRPTVAAFGLLALTPVAHLVGDVPFMRLALPCAVGLVTATCSRGVATLYAAVTLAWVLSTGSTEAGSVTVVGFAVVAGAISGVLGAMYRRSGVREEELVDAVAERERAISEVRRAERVRIADEIHDGIARQLTVIAIQAKVLSQTDDASVRAVSEAAIADNAAEALADLRRVLNLDGGPRPVDAGSATLDDWDSAVEEVVHQLGESGADVVVDIAPDVTVSPVISSVLVRVLREAAHNIRLHASTCTRVAVTLAEEPDGVSLSVVNDRPRRPVADEGLGGGYGIVRLTEVAGMLGGSFVAEPTSDGGWRVRVSLPRH